ncbi:hypothetical protein CDAR_251531 [Caerostris darwini]|uniref:Clathrin adaptor alpha/beta/gamma-adaptin appendage Ig-like subdomain domain-containing protein n=1 Tax=Caerostris darwini TaxID=1538125 RepID=A0AAV4RE21_9ARAC|nr:hypothetical protein CDAR_251531 [Caerostris darwini]
MVVHRLNRIIKYPSIELQDYNYYFVPAPWLIVKLLRLLQCLPFPIEPSAAKNFLIESIELIFNRAQEPPKTKKIEHRNCRNAVMFEAINYIYHLNSEASLQMRACNILDMNLKQNDSNLRCLALETMQLLSKSVSCKERIKQQLKPIMDSLKYENDSCMQQKSADLLCSLCDRNNVDEIIEQLFHYLEDCDVNAREEVVLKIAVLAENYLCDQKYYIDTILKLLKLFGDYVKKVVWYRFIHIVTNNKNVHGYAAKSVFDALSVPPWYDTFMAVAGYILGEFGNLIAGDNKANPNIQLQLLCSKFSFCCKETKAILLTTFVKFTNLFPELKQKVKNIFINNMRNSDPEIQQRAAEYAKLCEVLNRNNLATVLDEMPHFENKNLSVDPDLQRLRSKFTELSLKNESQNESVILGRSYSESLQNSSINKPVQNDDIPQRSSTVPQNAFMANNYYETLVEIFSDNDKGYNNLPISQSTSTLLVTSNEEIIQNLFWHKNGVLYENSILLVLINEQFLKHTGTIRLKYKNKTSHLLHNFVPFFHSNDGHNKLLLQMKPCSGTIQANEEIEHEIVVECIQDFNHRPSMSINFICNGLQQSLILQLPLTLNKFIEPITLNFDQFFCKWNSMQNCQDCIVVFPAKYIMNKDLVRRKIIGLNMNILEDIDENPNNFVGAGIFYSRMIPAGILLRLECNFSTFMYRLTVKSIKRTVTEEIVKVFQLLL